MPEHRGRAAGPSDSAAGSGIGVDLIEIGRLEAALERRPRLAERLFTSEELAYAAARRRPARHLAVRFAAKEATVKALGSAVAPREVEVAVDPDGAPRLALHGRAAALAAGRGARLDVSLSHSRELAVAFVTSRP